MTSWLERVMAIFKILGIAAFNLQNGPVKWELVYLPQEGKDRGILSTQLGARSPGLLMNSQSPTPALDSL